MALLRTRVPGRAMPGQVKTVRRKGVRVVAPWAAKLLRSWAETLEAAPPDARRGDPPLDLPPAQRPAGPARHRGGDRHAGAHRESLEGLLWAHLSEPPNEPDSRLHVISLAEIRQAFGDEWPRLAGKAAMIAESVIRSHLAPGDRFCRRGDEAFLLLFADGHETAPEERLDSILAGIRRQLLGAKADTAGAFGVRATNVTLAQIIDGGVVLGGPLVTIAAPAQPSGSAAPVAERMTPSELAARIHRQISFAFAPVWTAAAQRVESYVCLARRDADYGSFQGTWVLNGGYSDPFSLGVDLRAAEATAADLRRLMKAPDAVPDIILPLHLRSLCGEGGMKVLRKLERSIGPNERAHIIYEIIGPGPGMPLASLPSLIHTLRSLGKGVYVRAVPTAVEDLAPWVGQADALGLDLNDLARHGADPRTRTRALRDFFKTTAQAGLPSTRYLWDARTMEEATAALSLGASFLCGAAGGGEAVPQAKPPFFLSRRHMGLSG